MAIKGADSLNYAEQLLREGKKQEAQAVLVEYIQGDPSSARAWWMLSFAIPDLQKQTQCVERVLKIDPSNPSARARLEKLKGRSVVQASTPEVKPSLSPVKKNSQFLQYAVLSIMGCVIVGIIGFAAAMIAQKYRGVPMQSAPAEAVSFPQNSLPATWTPTPTSTLIPTHTLASLTTPLPETSSADSQPGTSVPKSKIGPYNGYYAPDFSLTDVHTQQTVKLSNHEGKAVVVYFWATWCGICKTEMPSMQAVYKGYHDDGLVFLAVDVRESAAQARDYSNALGLTFPILNDSNGSIAARYEVTGYPTFYFIEPSGVISSIQIGGMDYWKFNTKIRKLLKLE